VVRLELYKGSARIVGRRSPQSLYSLGHVTFEEDRVYGQGDPRASSGSTRCACVRSGSGKGN
jgi:argininosuccinate synthase